MIKKYFAVFMMSFSFINFALALDYNPKLLESNSEHLSHKLCSHVVIEPGEILESLNFVYKSDVIKETFSRFEEVQEKVSSILTDSRFSIFFETCRGIDESGDDEVKVSIRMLLTAVFDKYSLHFKRLEKLRRAKSERREIPTPQLLGRANKMIPLDYSDKLFGVKAYFRCKKLEQKQEHLYIDISLFLKNSSTDLIKGLNMKNNSRFLYYILPILLGIFLLYLGWGHRTAEESIDSIGRVCGLVMGLFFHVWLFMKKRWNGKPHKYYITICWLFFIVGMIFYLEHYTKKIEIAQKYQKTKAILKEKIIEAEKETSEDDSIKNLYAHKTTGLAPWMKRSPYLPDYFFC